jgi:hypothetical protein
MAVRRHFCSFLIKHTAHGLANFGRAGGLVHRNRRVPGRPGRVDPAARPPYRQTRFINFLGVQA